MSDKDKKQAYPVINIEECKACGRCVLACPVNVLEMSEELNKRGYRYCVYKGSGCIGCGNCFYTCPEPSAIEVYIPIKKSNKKPSAEQ